MDNKKMDYKEILEINIIYNINGEKNYINLFGDEFVRNNRNY